MKKNFYNNGTNNNSNNNNKFGGIVMMNGTITTKKDFVETIKVAMEMMYATNDAASLTASVGQMVYAGMKTDWTAIATYICLFVTTPGFATSRK